jgi:lipopolysaccharide biosynthesis regulator YciM
LRRARLTWKKVKKLLGKAKPEKMSSVRAHIGLGDLAHKSGDRATAATHYSRARRHLGDAASIKPAPAEVRSLQECFSARRTAVGRVSRCLDPAMVTSASNGPWST